MSTDDRREQLKAEYIALRGVWSPVWDQLLDEDPEFFAAYLKFSGVPFRDGGPPRPEDQGAPLVAIDAAGRISTSRGSRLHIRRAIEHGATEAELLEVLAAHRDARASTRVDHRRADPVRGARRQRHDEPRTSTLLRAPGAAQGATSRRTAATGTRSGTASSSRPRLLRGATSSSRRTRGSTGCWSRRSRSSSTRLRRRRRRTSTPRA